MSLNTQHISGYSWRTIVRNVILLSTPNTYRVGVSPIDLGNPGASLPVEVGFLLIDNAGHVYPIIDVGVGTIDVEDIFGTGENPQSGLTGIVCKSANKGRSLYLPQGLMNYLDKSAKPYLDSIAWSILWANDPNSIRIPFANINNPSIINYQLDQVDGVNLSEDYGENPKVQLFTLDSEGVYWERQEVPIRYFTDGLLQSIIYDLADNYTGYITLSR